MQALQNEVARIKANVEDSKLFLQMGDRGTFREGIIRQFLRPFLPDCYGISAGEVFDSDGGQSAQVDIVIYDALFSTVLFRDRDVQLFPAESVFGSIEIKSRLDSHELQSACDNIASLKQLNRQSTDMMDLTPLSRFPITEVFSYNTRRRNHYICGVLAYSGISSNAVTDALNVRRVRSPSTSLMLPDYIFVIDPGYVVARLSYPPDGPLILAPGSDVHYSSLEAGKDTLSLFYLTLNLLLREARLRTADYGPLWRQLLREIQARASKENR
jgi:hypothetical protein